MQNSKELNCCTLINIPQMKRGASSRAQRGPLGSSVGRRRVTRHRITQGRWEIQLGSVDNILLRLSYLSWFPPPPQRLAASHSVPINIQTFAPRLRVSISGTIQDQKKNQEEEHKIFSLTALFPHPLSSGANHILTNQWGTKDHFLTAHIKERTLRKLVRSRRFNNQTFSHSRYN